MELAGLRNFLWDRLLVQMTSMTERQQKNMLRSETARWQWAAIGLFILSLLANLSIYGAHELDRQAWSELEDGYQERLAHAEKVRDQAVREMVALTLASAREREGRAAQAAAYEAVVVYRYIGECTITAYCPCEACCGRWADGVTATGLPAGPGVVAVDPEVIPLGATVIIDGQRYLAADTGVTGKHVDVCMMEHAATVEAGVRKAEVWVIAP